MLYPFWVLCVSEVSEQTSNISSPHQHGGHLIAVHCTHGVNRTGYFICRYMIERLNIPPKEALERFRLGRGHEIERMNYVNDLMSGCKGGLETSLQCSVNQPKQRGGNCGRECDYQGDKYSNWRNDCRYQLSFETGNDNSNFNKPRKCNTLVYQSEAGYDGTPGRFRYPRDGPSHFQWTPYNQMLSLQPPSQNKRNQKIFTPKRTKSFTTNSQLPHYGISSHISYGRIRDDDQWAGDLQGFNNGTSPNDQRSSRYGHSRHTTNTKRHLSS